MLGDGVAVNAAEVAAGEALAWAAVMVGKAVKEGLLVGASKLTAAADAVVVKSTATVAGEASTLTGCVRMTRRLGWARLELLAVIAMTPSTTSRAPNRPLSVIRFIGLGDYPLAKVLFLEWYQIGRRKLLYQRKELP